MASKESMTQVLSWVAIKAAKTAIMAMTEAEGLSKSRRASHLVERASRPTMRQPTFDWKAQDKFNELNNFKIKGRHKYSLRNIII